MPVTTDTPNVNASTTPSRLTSPARVAYGTNTLGAASGTTAGSSTSQAAASSPTAPPAADRRAQAQAHNMLGVLARNAREPQPALVHLERSLALAQELRDEPPPART